MGIEYTVRDKVAEIVVESPPVNALNCAGWQELARVVDACGDRDDVSAVVIAASGRGFCAGVDIKELAANPGLIVDINRACYATFANIYRCPVPVVVAAHGYVLGGGIGIVGSADIVVASRDATFGLPEIDRGAMGAATHAMRLFGMQTARWMLYTGNALDADEAHRLGGLHAVVEPDELLPSVRAIAAAIASKSPLAVRLAKQSLNGIELLDVPQSYRFEQGLTLELYASGDSSEARAAFVEKREAHFQEAS